MESIMLNRTFEHQGLMYMVTSAELVDTDYGPENKVCIRCLRSGENYVRQESATVEKIIEWFKQEEE
jgi:hypothetical protein